MAMLEYRAQQQAQKLQELTKGQRDAILLMDDVTCQPILIGEDKDSLARYNEQVLKLRQQRVQEENQGIQDYYEHANEVFKAHGIKVKVQSPLERRGSR